MICELYHRYDESFWTGRYYIAHLVTTPGDDAVTEILTYMIETAPEASSIADVMDYMNQMRRQHKLEQRIIYISIDGYSGPHKINGSGLLQIDFDAFYHSISSGPGEKTLIGYVDIDFSGWSEQIAEGIIDCLYYRYPPEIKEAFLYHALG